MMLCYTTKYNPLKKLPPCKRDRKLVQQILCVENSSREEERMDLLLKELVALENMPKV